MDDHYFAPNCFFSLFCMIKENCDYDNNDDDAADADDDDDHHDYFHNRVGKRVRPK